MTCSGSDRSSFDFRLGLCVSLVLASAGCFEDPVSSTTTTTSEESGDGDGDATMTGDGDGDATTTGDGDGDATTGDGDGDGDATTTGDGDGDGDGEAEIVVFDFFAMACAAEWITSENPDIGGQLLECGAEDVGMGAAYTLDQIDLEDGTVGERVLVVAPWSAATGATTGAFTNIDVSGTTTPLLRATVGCPDLAQSCDFQWQLYARESGTNNLPTVVDDGFESYNGQLSEIELDLSPLMDTPIEVVFVVLANGEASSDDNGLFVYPRIVDAG